MKPYDVKLDLKTLEAMINENHVNKDTEQEAFKYLNELEASGKNVWTVLDIIDCDNISVGAKFWFALTYDFIGEELYNAVKSKLFEIFRTKQVERGIDYYAIEKDQKQNEMFETAFNDSKAECLDWLREQLVSA